MLSGSDDFDGACAATDDGHHVLIALNAERHYGLSMQAALRQLKDLNLLSESGYKTLTIQLSANGWRKSEPEPMPCKPPQRFESPVFRGLAEGLISKSRAGELLRQPAGSLDPNFLGPPESP
ncbi:hypothetical protein [Pseudomonas sp. MWU13-2105]|uniref:hypothetical protein n=1 Tax=Pseudomonas sp. MWU13-2105 TaxID=2935074 RepID=UPI00200FFF51|nr:hypothetical protein [Pseudomonas sp. MWU13-2105]